MSPPGPWTGSVMRHFDDFIARRSIRTLVVLLILGLTVPTLTGVLFLGQGRYQLRRAQIVRQAMDMAKAFARRHEEAVLQARTLLATIAAQPGFADREPDWQRDYLSRIAQANPQYSSLGYLAPDGTAIASSEPTAQGMRFGDRDYLREAVSRLRFSIGQAVVGRSTGQQVLPFAMPVMRGHRLAGVLILGLRLDEYQRLVDSLALPEGFHFILFDRYGTRLLRFPADDSAPVGGVSPPAETVLARPDASGAFEAVDTTGVPITYAFINPKSDMDDAALGTLAGIPSSYLAGQIDSELASTLLLLVVVTAAILAAGSLASSRIAVGGLIAMRDKAVQIAKTKVRIPLGEVPGCREVKDLARSFETMTEALDRDRRAIAVAKDALHRSQGELETRVERRTIELSEANRRLRESEERTRVLIETAPEAIVVYDCDRDRLANANSKALALLGPSREDMASGRLGAGPGAGDVLAALREHGRRVLSGEAIVLERFLRDPQGLGLTCEIRLSPLPSLGAAQIRASIIDISERKRSEERLRQINRQLAQVSARAQDMAARAELASAAKSDFLDKMSREIRHPLDDILGATGQALEMADDPLLRGCLTNALASSHSLLALVEDIADLSRIEARRLVLEPVDFDLGEMLGTLERSFGAMAQRKGIELRLQIQPGLPSLLRGDAARLRQVLGNLLENAVACTESGTMSLRVTRSWPQRPGLAGLRFEVADTGPGISPDVAEAIFQPFVTDEPTASRTAGTGLGLAIAKGLVELFGGTLTLAGGPGQGAVFAFEVFMPPGDPARIRTPAPQAPVSA